MTEKHISNIMIVIVLYEEKWESTNIRDVIFELMMKRRNKYRLVIYDNSTESQQIYFDKDDVQFDYYHNTNNGMLAEAYNFALKKANEIHCEWLMLFDQDSQPDLDYFDQINKKIIEISDNQEIVALTPKVFSMSQLISPTIIDRFGRFVPICSEFNGVHDGSITAINSGTVLRVSYMNSIGGFNLDFPLDILDHWYFNSIQKDNKKVFILNCRMEHELSVQDYNKNISLIRYESIIDSEVLFYSKYTSKTEYYLYIFKLFLRVFKQIIFVKNKRIAFLTFKKVVVSLFNLELFNSKK